MSSNSDSSISTQFMLLTAIIPPFGSAHRERRKRDEWDFNAEVAENKRRVGKSYKRTQRGKRFAFIGWSLS